MRHRTFTALTCSLLSTSLAFVLVACPGGSGGGFGGLFDDHTPVDEDYDRLSPALRVQGAFEDECSEQEDTETPLYQNKLQFARALCLCGNLEEVGNAIQTRSYSQTWGSDEKLASVGINGSLEVVGNIHVEGNLDVAGGLDGVGNLVVEGDLISGGHVDLVASWNVLGNAWVAGDLDAVGSLNILEDLYINGDVSAVGSVEYKNLRKGFRYKEAPCGCGPGETIDVAARVRQNSADNDNDLLPSGIGADTLRLPSGQYYVENPGDLVGTREILVEGRAALFIDGDLDTVGSLNIKLEPGAELEMWVAGSIKTVGNLQFASQQDARARAFKLYMGGRGSTLINVGNAEFFGSIYAPETDIEYVGNLQVHGSLFANNLTGTGNLTLYYDTDIMAPAPCIDQNPEPVDQECQSDSDCTGDMICDTLTKACIPEPECLSDAECGGNSACVDRECVFF